MFCLKAFLFIIGSWTENFKINLERNTHWYYNKIGNLASNGDHLSKNTVMLARRANRPKRWLLHFLSYFCRWIYILKKNWIKDIFTTDHTFSGSCFSYHFFTTETYLGQHIKYCLLISLSAESQMLN